MGRKLNPDYRAKAAKRHKVPRCAFCGRRSKHLPTYPNPWTGEDEHYHHSCHVSVLAEFKAQQEEAESRREKEREAHLAVKNFWDNPPAWNAYYPGSGEYNAKHGFER